MGTGVPWGGNTSCLGCRSHCWSPLPTWGACAVAHCALCLQSISSWWKSSGFGWAVSCMDHHWFSAPTYLCTLFHHYTKPTLSIGRTQGSIHRLDSWEPSISEQCSIFPIRPCGLHGAQQLTEGKRNCLCFLGSGAQFMVWSGYETHSPDFWRAVTSSLSCKCGRCSQPGLHLFCRGAVMPMHPSPSGPLGSRCNSHLRNLSCIHKPLSQRSCFPRLSCLQIFMCHVGT